MDQYEEIMQKCVELGTLIGKTEIFQNFKQAEYELLHNDESKKLIEDLQNMKQEQRSRKMAGGNLSDDEIRALQALEEACLKDPQVFKSNDVNNKFQGFMETITKKIKEGIQSSDAK